MSPTPFPEANASFGPPKGMTEEQVMTVPAFVGESSGGQHDGQPVVVVAWLPTKEEIEILREGWPIFITMFGGLAPHYLSTNFHAATHPA